MSSVVAFLFVAVILAVVATVVIREAEQPATDGDRTPRDPWRERIRPVGQWLARSARDLRRWVAAGVASWRDRRQQRRQRHRAGKDARRAERRDRKDARRAERRARAEVDRRPAPPARAPDPSPVATVKGRPDGVVTTALRVPPDSATAETAGEPLRRPGPGFFTRLRSAAGLVVLIGLLGLALATILGLVAALVGAAVDSFVN